jgi:hypothetical protein
MAEANILQLRQLLTEKFPGLRTRLDEPASAPGAVWPTGLPQLDEPLRGGLPKGAMTEIVAEKRGSGSALLIAGIIRRACRENQFVALVDGRDSLEVTQVGGELSRLLWVRCRSANEAMKAADLLLRDGNVPLVVLDLAANPAGELRKIPATTWYRFQRLLEQTATACLVLTPRAMVSPAQARLELRSSFSLDALDREPELLLRELKLEAIEGRRVGAIERPLQKTA